MILGPRLKHDTFSSRGRTTELWNADWYLRAGLHSDTAGVFHGTHGHPPDYTARFVNISQLAGWWADARHARGENSLPTWAMTLIVHLHVMISLCYIVSAV